MYIIIHYSNQYYKIIIIIGSLSLFQNSVKSNGVLPSTTDICNTLPKELLLRFLYTPYSMCTTVLAIYLGHAPSSIVGVAYPYSMCTTVLAIYLGHAPYSIVGVAYPYSMCTTVLAIYLGHSPS